jgi:outer membrane receptor protein involved in Fe transport
MTFLWLAVAALGVSAESAAVIGHVRDASGGIAAGASVSLLSPQQAPVASTRTDAQGQFRFEGVPPGSYLVVAHSPGFATARTAVLVKEGAASPSVDIVLETRVFGEEVTVSASLGTVDDLGRVAQRVNVIDEEDVAFRAKAVVAQAALEEPGVHLQRTSPTMGEFYVRGLTGTKVNVYVDGVRYTTGAQRGGVSTFFNLIEPAALGQVEVLRGPSSAEYGSDAMGGSVQFLTRMPTIPAGGGAWGGSWDVNFGSADVSYGSALSVSRVGSHLSVAATIAGRRSNTLRTGQGIDSHNSVTRFFGLPSDIAIDDRMPDTAFTQYGGRLKLAYALSPTSRLTASYLRGQQDGGKRYDQLLGGDGNLVSDLLNLMMDNAFLRWEKTGTWFDRVSLTYSFGAQREERANQGGNGNPRASINHEYERTVANGGQLLLAKTWGAHSVTAGGDFFLEKIKAPSYGLNPVTNVATVRRGRVPDGATFDSYGIFVTDAFDVVPGRLRLSGALRWGGSAYEARASDAPVVNGQPLWPDDSLDASSLTFRAGTVFTPGAGGFQLAAYVARGYRAPNITDLGTFGLTGSGYEVSNREVGGRGATVGSTAGVTAVSTGEAVRILDPETSLSYELTARYQGAALTAELTGFLSEIDHNVAKQALILPPGAAGTTLGSETIARQLPNGVVFVPVSPNPVLVRANFDKARVQGLEGRANWRIASSWTANLVGTYIHAEDRSTRLPPNVEGGTPAPEVWLAVRYSPGGGRRFWVEPYLHAADRQDRLSSLDLDDRRTGASRSRTSIAAFFTNGARARGLVGSGPDGVAGNADDVLLATGETLPQIQDRVLGPGVASSSLYTAVPGYVTFGLRGALRFGARHEVLVDFENLGDRNYRGVSWGLDAPGRGAFVRYRLSF